MATSWSKVLTLTLLVQISSCSREPAVGPYAEPDAFNNGHSSGVSVWGDWNFLPYNRSVQYKVQIFLSVDTATVWASGATDIFHPISRSVQYKVQMNLTIDRAAVWAFGANDISHPINRSVQQKLQMNLTVKSTTVWASGASGIFHPVNWSVKYTLKMNLTMGTAAVWASGAAEAAPFISTVQTADDSNLHTDALSV
jgi:DNA-binding cell septation regulator SpoVG